MLKRRQSSNVIDARPGKGDRLPNPDDPQNQIRNALNYKASVQASVNADRLGLGSAATDLQNTANKIKAKGRTRMGNVINR